MRALLAKTAVFVVAFAFTAFVFANTYEVVFNRDIALAHSLEKSANQAAINAVVKDFATRISSDSTDTVPALDNISRIEIPALEVQLSAEDARRIDGQWYVRPSTAHYIGLNKNKHGVTVDYAVYLIKSWRTLPAPERIEQGMEVVFYYGSGARSSLQVTEKRTLPLGRSLLASKTESRQVLLMIEDHETGVYHGYSLEARD